MGGDKPLPYESSGIIDATNSNTAPTWTNHPHALRPVASQQVQTNSATQFINVADEISTSRRTYNPTNSAAGDTEAIAARGSRGVPPRISQAGRLRSYLVLINGAVPTIQAQTGVYPSELFSHRNPTYNENTIAVSSDRGALEISGTNLMYEGTRVKTWIVGRDLNPGGRGNGLYVPNGYFSVGSLRPTSSGTPIASSGNSVNNPGPGAGGADALSCDPICTGNYGAPHGPCCCRTDKAPLGKCLCLPQCKIVPVCDDKPTRHPSPNCQNVDWTDLGQARACCAEMGADDAEAGKYNCKCWYPMFPCCKEYCDAIDDFTGDSKGSGGGGCSGCSRSGTSSVHLPNITYHSSCSQDEITGISEILKHVFACAVGAGANYSAVRLAICLNSIGSKEIRCRQPGLHPGGLCCMSQNNVWTCCRQKNQKTGQWEDNWAIACKGYIFLCPTFFAGSTPKPGADYGSFWCDKYDTIVHELLHYCGYNDPQNESVACDITEACECACKSNIPCDKRHAGHK